MLGMDFRDLLSEAGVQRVWLASRSGWSRSTVDDWCDGTRVPAAEVIEWLLRRVADPAPQRVAGKNLRQADRWVAAAITPKGRIKAVRS